MMFTVNNKLGMGGNILSFILLPYMEILKKNKTFSFSPNLGTTLQFLLKKIPFVHFLWFRGAFFNVPLNRPVRF